MTTSELDHEPSRPDGGWCCAQHQWQEIERTGAVLRQNMTNEEIDRFMETISDGTIQNTPSMWQAMLEHKAEVERLRGQLRDARNVIRSLLWQHAYPTGPEPGLADYGYGLTHDYKAEVERGRHTGGLSANEEAFAFLGIPDPAPASAFTEEKDE